MLQALSFACQRSGVHFVKPGQILLVYGIYPQRIDLKYRGMRNNFLVLTPHNKKAALQNPKHQGGTFQNAISQNSGLALGKLFSKTLWVCIIVDLHAPMTIDGST